MARVAAILSCVVFSVSFALVSTGCNSPEEPAKPKELTDPNAPPPPTPEQISKRVITDLGLDQPLPPPGSRMSPVARGATLESYKRQYNELSKTPEGKAALQMV